MKPSYMRRIRRKPAPSREAGMFKKQSAESTFFGEAAHDPFFQPAAVQRKCEKCEEEEKSVKRMAGKKEEEEKKLHKKEDEKEKDKLVQKKDEKEEDKKLHRMEDKKEEDKKLQRVEDKKEEEKKLQRQAEGASAPQTSTAAYIDTIGGKGHSLAPQAQQFFGQRMNYDFSNVRIHTSKEAAESASAINAQAYTYKNHVVFNEGKYNTESREGKKLLAHELTHVIQQEGNNGDQATGQEGAQVDRSASVIAEYPIEGDRPPARLFKERVENPGLTEPILNDVVTLPSDGAGHFNAQLKKAAINERSLDAIARPDLSDSSLDLVRANLQELQFGSYGRHVQLIQEALIAWGEGQQKPIKMLPAYGADKIYGSETRDGVWFFQEKHPELGKPDGIVGDHTLNALQAEMNNLHGSFFSFDPIPHNAFRGIIHMPPPSSEWKSIMAEKAAFKDHPLLFESDEERITSKLDECGKKNTLVAFQEKNGSVEATRIHEQVHEKEQKNTMKNHLVPWDRKLAEAQAQEVSVKAASKEEGEKKLYALLGIPAPFRLSQRIVTEMMNDNRKFHSSQAGEGVPISAEADCTKVIITFSKNTF